jgi:hypothetical protein
MHATNTNGFGMEPLFSNNLLEQGLSAKYFLCSRAGDFEKTSLFLPEGIPHLSLRGQISSSLFGIYLTEHEKTSFVRGIFGDLLPVSASRSLELGTGVQALRVVL